MTPFPVDLASLSVGRLGESSFLEMSQLERAPRDGVRDSVIETAS